MRFLKILLSILLVFVAFISYAQPANDNYANAIDVSGLINFCSADAAYTTIGATPDLNAGSCWNNSGPLLNVWFSFVATTTNMKITVDRGGAQGSQRATQAALWESDGTTEVACKRYSASVNEDVVLEVVGTLTIGNTYYISVDALSTSYDGTFSLCLADNDISYDFYQGAIDVSSLINTCSADAIYTTIGATPDSNAGSCWNNSGPLLNRWFSFVATTTNMKITVDRGGAQGSQRATQMALWQNDGTTEVACKRYSASVDEDVILEVVGTLTIGNTYYISVDALSTSYDGTFSLCLADDNVSYDFYQGAIDVSSLINTCSADAIYTTIGATPDLNAGSCWNNSGPLLNRWFSFVATTTNMKITVDRGGAQGSQRATQLALWQNDGTTEVACKRYSASVDEDVVLEVVGTLTIGNTYYISVDALSTSYDGTFSLCLADDDVSYDYYQGAIDVSSLINTCSADAIYTTIGATPDLNAGSCWNNSGPQLNRWFSFVATTTNMKITVDRGGAQGSQRATQLALWQSDGTTEVACKRYSASVNEDVVLEVVGGLTIGNTYYISVDTYNTSYDGTFSLCLADNDVSYDYYQGAIDVSSLINTCSADAIYTTIGATPDLNAGSCWNNSGPQLNRWFSFVATTTNMKITVDRGGAQGSQRATQLALWQSDGTTEVACKRYSASVNEDVVLEVVGGLTIGNTYYISVDTYNTSYDGTFSLCLADNDISHDYYEGAIPIADINNWCSTDAAYTTIGATPDLNAGSCWNNSGPQLNVWFSFVAVSDGISVTIDRGGAQGSQRATQVAIWESNGTTEVACKRYSASVNEDVIVEATGSLTPGSTYYISVDTYSTSYDGTFTLCVDNNPSYDFYEGAYEITNLNNWCSSDAQFTTIGASPDKNAGSCWNNSGPKLNRWFKFTAISPNVTIIVDRGASKGTQRATQLALWQSDGTTEVGCQRYVGINDDVTLTNTGLTVGNVYYISVDTYSTSYDGTFTLCVNNIDGTYYSRADGDWSSNTTWSTVGFGGITAADYPQAGDIANIGGYLVTITGNEACGELNISAATSTTDLTINNASLDVQGEMTVTNPGNNINSSINIINSGALSINDELTLNRNGGNATVDITIDNSTVTVNKDLNVYSTAGTNDNTISLVNGASLTITEDALLSNTGGPKTFLNSDASTVTFTQDLTLTASADNKIELGLANAALINIKKDIIRGTPAYGILNCATGTTVYFNSTNYLQTLPHSTGSGTGDTFTYQNVVINNSRITSPQLTLDGAVTINESLTLTNGEVLTTASNLLTMVAGSTVSGASAASFVDGPMKKIGNTDFEFPVGNNNFWQPIGIANLTGNAATEFSAEYFVQTPPDNLNLKSPDPNGDMYNISGLEYWDLTNSGTASDADVTLYWKDQSRSDIDNGPDLQIAHYTGTEWENLGQNAINFADPGSITVTGITSFSPFAFGSMSNTVNALPVELLSFAAIKNLTSIELVWATASEHNNDFFAIEKSTNAEAWQEIAKVAGTGNSTMRLDYSYIDKYPVKGNQYYRLRQVDYDGTFSYSKAILINHPGLNKVAFNLYPNPVERNILYIHSPSLVEINTVHLIDINGRNTEVKAQFLKPGEYQISLETVSGIYIIVIEAEEGQYRQKILKL